MNGNCLKRSQEAILTAMGHLLLDAEERGGPIERRSEIRSPVRVPVELRLLPSGVDDVLDIPNRPGITAHTSNLSPSGLGLLHSEPLESHHVLATFQLLRGETVSVVVRLTWRCSLGECGYASGGEVVAVVEGNRAPGRSGRLVTAPYS